MPAAARGAILLIAPVATVWLAEPAFWRPQMSVWFIIYFAWTSTLAMPIRAITGQTGFGPGGPVTNRLVFVLYACGAALLFPGLFVLAIGLFRAL